MSTTVPAEPPRLRNCVACGADKIPLSVLECPVCRHSMTPQLCVICGKAIPARAKICSVCKSYQRGWRVVSNLAAAFPVMAIIALGSALYTVGTYLYDRNSSTKFKVTSVDEKVVHLMVWNTGRKPSRLIAYRLSFLGQLPLEDTDLRQVEGDAVIESGKPGKVGLDVAELTRNLKPGGKEHYTKDEIEALVSAHDSPRKLQIEVTVEESGHLWNLTDGPFNTMMVDKVPAGSLKMFILGRLPDVDVP